MIGLGETDDPLLEAPRLTGDGAEVPDASIEPAGTVDGAHAIPAAAERCQVWFNGPDDAYLAAAALQRYLEVPLVTDVILVPTNRGPGLDMPMEALSLGFVRGLLRRFGGHVDRTPGGVPAYDRRRD